MTMIASRIFSLDHAFPGTTSAAHQRAVVIVCEDPDTIEQLTPICEFLDLKIEVVAGGAELDHVLRECNPMAVVAGVDNEVQDGFQTMKQAARYRHDLPILLLTAGDPVLMGAADAVQSVWGLTSVTCTEARPIAGPMIAFLFDAGRRAGCMRLIAV
jgi:CheY-like chemotaxis protein